jgi:hypothetical protein
MAQGQIFKTFVSYKKNFNKKVKTMMNTIVKKTSFCFFTIAILYLTGPAKAQNRADR